MPDLGHSIEWWQTLRCNSLASTRGIGEQGRTEGSDRDGMNLVVIEEHQAGDLVFAQVYYLYILLEATSAYVNVPIAKVSVIQVQWLSVIES